MLGTFFVSWLYCVFYPNQFLMILQDCFNNIIIRFIDFQFYSCVTVNFRRQLTNWLSRSIQSIKYDMPWRQCMSRLYQSIFNFYSKGIYYYFYFLLLFLFFYYIFKIYEFYNIIFTRTVLKALTYLG